MTDTFLNARPVGDWAFSVTATEPSSAGIPRSEVEYDAA